MTVGSRSHHGRRHPPSRPGPLPVCIRTSPRALAGRASGLNATYPEAGMAETVRASEQVCRLPIVHAHSIGHDPARVNQSRDVVPMDRARDGPRPSTLGRGGPGKGRGCADRARRSGVGSLPRDWRAGGQHGVGRRRSTPASVPTVVAAPVARFSRGPPAWRGGAAAGPVRHLCGPPPPRSRPRGGCAVRFGRFAAVCRQIGGT